MLLARFTCKCGNLFSNSACPNDIQLTVFTDPEFDEILKLDSVYDIPLPENDWWKCPLCERIYVFDRGTLIRTYSLEKN